MPDEIQAGVPDVARCGGSLSTAVTDDYTIVFGEPDVDGVIRFLCDERQFSRARVTHALRARFQASLGLAKPDANPMRRVCSNALDCVTSSQVRRERGAVVERPVFSSPFHSRT